MKSKKSRPEAHLTAIIYDKRGRVLSIGKNSYVKTHPVQAKFANECGDVHKMFLHAEIDAIIRCRDISKAHRIFVSRPTKTGYGLAKPCPICMHAIKTTTPIKIIDHT